MATEQDVIIIGGSYAGISAAMPLARARRRVTIFDGGARRNRFTHAAHGFFGQDGRDPAEIQRIGKEQLLRYETVTWVDAPVTQITRGFEANGVRAKRVILATGVRDILPPIEGLQERWGKSAFVCPYCDGYEQNMGKLGVIGIDEKSHHQAMLLKEWGTPTLVPMADIARVTDKATLVLKDGRSLVFDALFTGVKTELSGPVAEQLGCALVDGMLGKMIKVDDMQATTVPGVFACGDASRAMHSLAFAVADGFRAGVAAHASLFMG